MDVINYAASRRLLTVARGHPYERDALHQLFQGLDEFDVCHVEQPLAMQCYGPGLVDDYAALVCYDMPGVDFTAGAPPTSLAPEPQQQADFLAMLERGIGVVFLHHSLAAWPAWSEYARIVGGRFHYREADLEGRHWPDSGYRHKVRHQVSVALSHPVTAGLPADFEMVDELYLCPILEDQVEPLLRSDYRFTTENFFSAAQAVAGVMDSRKDWQHPPGSNLVGWLNSYGASPIVYLQGGDDAEAMSNPHFRQLVHNAIRWVGSDSARNWAARRAR